MKSLRELYKIGRGPSSSHTIAPERAAKLVKKEHPDADFFRVILFGSLALTGKGHGTDIAITDVLEENCEVVFDCETEKLHPNTMIFEVYRNNEKIGEHLAVSIGGGSLLFDGKGETETPDVYSLRSFREIKNYCEQKDISLYEYVLECEGEDIELFLSSVWESMKETLRRGIKATGIIPGGLGIVRKAASLYSSNHIDEMPETREHRLVCAYAYAVAEENACGGKVVTAPTCGACGVMPAVLYYIQRTRKMRDEDIIRGLAVGGLMGNLIKHNASISGAECGCQAEIGSACSMAAAALCETYKMSVNQIEYAAEIAIEHHLGLTCDPIWGLVQIPCIERNAVAAERALTAFYLANFLVGTREISFDLIIETMLETGKDLKKDYRETSTGGLAKLYKKKAE